MKGHDAVITTTTQSTRTPNRAAYIAAFNAATVAERYGLYERAARLWMDAAHDSPTEHHRQQCRTWARQCENGTRAKESVTVREIALQKLQVQQRQQALQARREREYHERQQQQVAQQKQKQRQRGPCSR